MVYYGHSGTQHGVPKHLEVKNMTKTKEALRRIEEKFDKLSPADKDRVVAYAEGAAAVRESLKRKKK